MGRVLAQDAIAGPGSDDANELLDVSEAFRDHLLGSTVGSKWRVRLFVENLRLIGRFAESVHKEKTPTKARALSRSHQSLGEGQFPGGGLHRPSTGSVRLR
jgi:hypothetical protein